MPEYQSIAFYARNYHTKKFCHQLNILKIFKGLKLEEIEISQKLQNIFIP